VTNAGDGIVRGTAPDREGRRGSACRIRVSEKGQVTIPKRLRDRLGLRPGTVLDFEESGGRLVARKLVRADHLDDLVGILDLPGGVDAHLDEARGPGPAGS